jgi:lysozyme
VADVQFVLDISHHQDLSLDLAQCRRDGVAAVLIKGGEGSSYVDPEFAANLAEARSTGLLVGAYWYVRATASAAAHVDKIRQVVPAGMAVIPDVEKDSGGVGLAREITRLLLAAGYLVPWLYLPRWYWAQIGSPSLAGLPPLWSSHYPDTIVGSLADEWADVKSSYWDGYGGVSVGLLQFSSSTRIAGHQPLDASAFPGTYNQLAAKLGGATIEEDDDMGWNDQFPVPAGPNVGKKFTAWEYLTWANYYANGIPELRAMVATVIANQHGDLTAAGVLAQLDTSVRQATSQAIAGSVLPALRDVVHEVLGEDRSETVDETADAIVAKLAEKLGAGA